MITHLEELGQKQILLIGGITTDSGVDHIGFSKKTQPRTDSLVVIEVVPLDVGIAQQDDEGTSFSKVELRSPSWLDEKNRVLSSLP